jgi:hypothetical protein
MIRRAAKRRRAAVRMTKSQGATKNLQLTPQTITQQPSSMQWRERSESSSTNLSGCPTIDLGRTQRRTIVVSRTLKIGAMRV